MVKTVAAFFCRLNIDRKVLLYLFLTYIFSKGLRTEIYLKIVGSIGFGLLRSDYSVFYIKIAFFNVLS